MVMIGEFVKWGCGSMCGLKYKQFILGERVYYITNDSHIFVLDTHTNTSGVSSSLYGPWTLHNSPHILPIDIMLICEIGDYIYIYRGVRNNYDYRMILNVLQFDLYTGEYISGWTDNSWKIGYRIENCHIHSMTFFRNTIFLMAEINEDSHVIFTSTTGTSFTYYDLDSYTLELEYHITYVIRNTAIRDLGYGNLYPVSNDGITWYNYTFPW